MSEEKIPTWGYRSGESKLFDLKPGERLPDGWADAPVAEAAAGEVAAQEEKPRKRKAKAQDEAEDTPNGDGN